MKYARVVASDTTPGYFRVLWHGAFHGGEHRRLVDAIAHAQGLEHSPEHDQQGWVAMHAEQQPERVSA
jgi:hypothetical protein